MNNTAHSSKNCPACEAVTAEFSAKVNGHVLMKCSSCGLIYMSDSSPDVDYNKLYTADGDYDGHIQEAATLQRGELVRMGRARRDALQQIQQMHPASVLEIGCGVGNFLAHLERLGIPCCGLDLSVNAIALAKKHLKSDVICGVLDDSAFGGRTFDVIVMWEVIEHLTDLNGVMKQIVARLNPGGRLLLSTPNYASTWLWKDLPNDPRSVPPVHVTFWNRKTLSEYLREIGLRPNVRPVSVAISAALRSKIPMAKLLVFADSIVRPSQRCTLFATGTKTG